MLSALLSALHLLALGIGLPAIFLRARWLRGPKPDRASVERALMADNFWGVASILWIGSGLLRAFGGFEKGTSFYLHSGAFYAKMGFLAFAIALELWPMIVLLRWRIRFAKNEPVTLDAAPRIAAISYLESALIVAIVVVAAFMARGHWPIAGPIW